MAVSLITGYAGQEHITSADAGSFNIAFVGAGEYVFDRGNEFACTIAGSNSVTIADGDGIMQGRHFRQKEGVVTDLTFDVGVSGLYRNDLICVEYRKDQQTYVESASLVVIKGTPTDVEESATDPTYTHGDITEAGQASLNQMPLYRVHFSGVAISEVTPLFSNVKSYAGFQDEYDQAVLDIQTAANEAIAHILAVKPTPTPYTIYASGWDSNGVYSFEADYPHTGYNITEIMTNENTTTAQKKAWNNCGCNGYYTTNIIKASGIIPSIDIPVTLFIEEI